MRRLNETRMIVDGASTHPRVSDPKDEEPEILIFSLTSGIPLYPIHSIGQSELVAVHIPHPIHLEEVTDGSLAFASCHQGSLWHSSFKFFSGPNKGRVSESHNEVRWRSWASSTNNAITRRCCSLCRCHPRSPSLSSIIKYYSIQSIRVITKINQHHVECLQRSPLPHDGPPSAKRPRPDLANCLGRD